MCCRDSSYVFHSSCILIYEEAYDSFWCDDHNEWAEGKCTDLDCGFCGIRPDKIEKGGVNHEFKSLGS